MTFLDQREIRDVADAVCQRISERVGAFADYSQVHGAVANELSARYGADHSKVDRFGQSVGRDWHLDEPTRTVHTVSTSAVKMRTGETELAAASGPEGTLWLLQKRLGQLKFEFIKFLIEHGQQTVEPIKADVEVVVHAKVVSVEVGNVPPRETGQYAYETYTLSSGIID